MEKAKLFRQDIILSINGKGRKKDLNVSKKKRTETVLWLRNMAAFLRDSSVSFEAAADMLEEVKPKPICTCCDGPKAVADSPSMADYPGFVTEYPEGDVRRELNKGYTLWTNPQSPTTSMYQPSDGLKWPGTASNVTTGNNPKSKPENMQETKLITAREQYRKDIDAAGKRYQDALIVEANTKEKVSY